MTEQFTAENVLNCENISEIKLGTEDQIKTVLDDISSMGNESFTEKQNINIIEFLMLIPIELASSFMQTIVTKSCILEFGKHTNKSKYEDFYMRLTMTLGEFKEKDLRDCAKKIDVMQEKKE